MAADWSSSADPAEAEGVGATKIGEEACAVWSAARPPRTIEASDSEIPMQWARVRVMAVSPRCTAGELTVAPPPSATRHPVGRSDRVSISRSASRWSAEGGAGLRVRLEEDEDDEVDGEDRASPMPSPMPLIRRDRATTSVTVRRVRRGRAAGPGAGATA